MRKIYYIIREIQAKMQRDEISAYASSIAFFLFSSLIPILMIICAAIPYTPLSKTDLLRIAMEITPESMNLWIIGLVTQIYVRSAGVLSVAILLAIWSAGKGMLALMRALNTIHGVVEKRGYFRLRMISSFYTIVVLVMIIVTLCLGVFGNTIIQFCIARMPLLEKGFTYFDNIRMLIVWPLLIVAFTFIYTYIPSKNLKLRYQIPGAVFTTIVWNIFSYGFSIYVDRFTRLSAFGTMGAIILFLLWMYFCNYIMLVGANINIYFQPVLESLYERKIT